MTTRRELLDSVERHSNRTFLVDAINQREISYERFHQLARWLAAELQRHGVHHGDRVAIMVPNCCELAILYFAAIYLGATAVPINPNSSLADVGFILAGCNPKLVVASQSCREKVAGYHGPTLTLVTAHESAPAPIDPDKTLVIDSLPETGSFIPFEHATDDDIIVIMYTSGTTAKPKGLAHKTGRMFRNATAFAAMNGVDQDNCFYLTLSMAYMGGFYNLLILPFLCGASVVIDHVFDARASLNFWDRVSRHQANTLWLAPTVMSILLKMDRGRTGEEYCRRSVRHAFVGFAPLPLKLKEDFEARYGLRLIENYGLSETLFVTARARRDYNQPGYVGEALPGIQLRVTADDGSVLAGGAEGELEILTPDLMAGYIDDHGVLQSVDAAQWFATGDFVHVDSQGSLCITGRKKDIIIRGGINISPAAIEEALLRFKGIVDAAVVSIPHELYGEDAVAVLKLEAGVELESILDAVVAYARENLAVHQQPARYLDIDEFPRTASGKVQKARLRELVREKFQLGAGNAVRATAVSSERASR